MSVNKKMGTHQVFIVELLGKTQPAITSKQSLTTTVFGLPRSNKHRLLNTSLYNEEWGRKNKMSNTIDTHRSQSPQKIEYNQLLQKYREKMKQQRKRHLKVHDYQGGYCIKGGHVLRQFNSRLINPRLSDPSLSCPKMDYEKAYKIISDIRQQKDANRDLTDELGKLPFLRKRHSDKHEKSSRKRIVCELKEQPQSLSLSPKKREPEINLIQQPYELVPWRSINDDQPFCCSEPM